MNSGQVKLIRVTPIIKRPTHALLCKEGFTFYPFPNQLREVHIIFMNRYTIGIGMRNCRNGIEFYCPSIDRPITLNTSGRTIVTGRNNKSTTCCIFATFLDYLACLTYNFTHNNNSNNHDYIIINNPSNFSQVVLDAETYIDIKCFLPNNDVGKTMTLTLQDRLRDRVSDMSYLYSDKFSNFHELIKNSYI